MKVLLPLCLAASLPAAAQGYLDSPNFGGSQVFSEGVNSLGNPARFDRCLPGWYLAAQQGDLRAKGNATALEDLAKGLDPAAALAALEAAPWASRATGYSLLITQTGLHASLSKEHWNGLTAFVDRDPAHLGANYSLNATRADLLRVDVDRLVMGAGSAEGQGGYGFAVRIERWTFGRQTAAANPVSGQVSFADAPSLLDSTATTESAMDYNLNGGYCVEMGQGLRFGVMGDHLIPKTVAGLELKGQYRAGFQLDLGRSLQLSVESDLNEATRLPITVPQKSLSGSLRLAFGPTVGLTLGAERRKLAGTAATTAGATLYWKLPAISFGFGFRFSNDRPLKSVLLRVNS